MPRGLANFPALTHICKINMGCQTTESIQARPTHRPKHSDLASLNERHATRGALLLRKVAGEVLRGFAKFSSPRFDFDIRVPSPGPQARAARRPPGQKSATGARAAGRPPGGLRVKNLPFLIFFLVKIWTSANSLLPLIDGDRFP